MCCGRPRQTVRTQQSLGSPVRSARALLSTSAQAAPAPRVPLALTRPVFEYVGATALTVVSPLTRKTYRFEKPGARIEIDPRDPSWIAFVPNLVPAT